MNRRVKMDVKTFLKAAKRYSDLGWAVQEQLENIVNGDPVADQNLNAVRLVHDFLKHLSWVEVEGVDRLIDEVEEEIAAKGRIRKGRR